MDELKKVFGSKVTLFDGGMGTMLISSGLRRGQPPEEWNLLHPDKVKDIHRRYLLAGAEIIQTNTFGATEIKLSASRPQEKLEVERVNREAVRLVREAIDEFDGVGRYIAGDIGPTGKFFPPVGTLTSEKARENFKKQVISLEKGGVDLFLIETMYDLREMLEAIRAVREISAKPVVVEMTFEKKPTGYFTMMGVSPEEFVEAVVGGEAAADVIGANCSISSESMINLAVEFRDLTKKPLIFQPNAGAPEMKRGMEVYGQKPEEFASDMEKIINMGANAVGGCCGTTPDFIRALHNLIVSAG